MNWVDSSTGRKARPPDARCPSSSDGPEGSGKCNFRNNKKCSNCGRGVPVQVNGDDESPFQKADST